MSLGVASVATTYFLTAYVLPIVMAASVQHQGR